MTHFQAITGVAIFTGLVITALTAIEHITGRPKGHRSYFRFGRGMIVSILIAQLGALGFRLQLKYPWVLFLFFTLLYLHGPLEYMRYYRFLYPARKIPPLLKLQMLPVPALFLLDIYLHSLPVDNKLYILGAFFGNPLQHSLIMIFAVCMLSMVSYTALLLYMEITSLRESLNKRPLRFSIMISLFFLASLVISCLYFVTADPDYILLGTSIICFSVILYFLFKNRFPDFFQLLAAEIKLQRYRRTLLNGLDPDAIHERLAELMRDEKLYQDMDLRMNDVAGRLMIKPHQLSQLLNERVKTDFRNYVNRFRIDEACRLLAGDPDRSIISICFEVGFNSKTAFNITFKKMTGLSPKEYREKSGTQL